MARKTKRREPPRVYWDACIFLDYVNGLPGRVEVLDALLDQCLAGTLEIWSSQLSITEVAFAAAEQAQQELDEDILEKIDTLWHPESPLTLVEVHEVVLRKARQLIRSNVSRGRSGLKAADAIHLATALHCNIPAFHTRDARLSKLGAVEGLSITPPQADGLIVFPSKPDQEK